MCQNSERCRIFLRITSTFLMGISFGMISALIGCKNICSQNDIITIISILTTSLVLLIILCGFYCKMISGSQITPTTNNQPVQITNTQY